MMTPVPGYNVERKEIYRAIAAVRMVKALKRKPVLFIIHRPSAFLPMPEYRFHAIEIPIHCLQE
ncbi:hypothetical protein [Halomonas campaniensis]|uniref:Uncharacterized protein n=1 Tax=Halomonas campaniensis TaxID=213554 RepID=A0A246S477_9GAMM|nr:hypothetical protein [Halomonas campaniensis]OWV31265.1 hypothetical protein JI62_01205 [Halomonas campaniensis]